MDGRIHLSVALGVIVRREGDDRVEPAVFVL